MGPIIVSTFAEQHAALIKACGYEREGSKSVSSMLTNYRQNGMAASTQVSSKVWQWELTQAGNEALKKPESALAVAAGQ